MRFLCLYKPGKPERPPSQQEMASMGKLIEESMKAGWLLATGGGETEIRQLHEMPAPDSDRHPAKS